MSEQQRHEQVHLAETEKSLPAVANQLRSRFLKGRPRFAAPDAPVPHKGDRPPFGCVLLTWERAA